DRIAAPHYGNVPVAPGLARLVVMPFRRVQIPEGDDHRLRSSLAADCAGRGLTVHRLDAVAPGSEPVIHLFFERGKISGSVRGKQLELRRHGALPTKFGR